MIRQLDIDTITLEKGSHTPDHTFCVMEAVAYAAAYAAADAAALELLDRLIEV